MDLGCLLNEGGREGDLLDVVTLAYAESVESRRFVFKLNTLTLRTSSSLLDEASTVTPSSMLTVRTTFSPRKLRMSIDFLSAETTVLMGK